MFKTVKHIETIDNTKSATGIKIIITFESDNHWRVTHERILSSDELAHDKIMAWNKTERLYLYIRQKTRRNEIKNRKN